MSKLQPKLQPVKEATMEKLELKFTYEKETKNTVRYKEVLGDVAHSSRDVAVGSLYIQREALGDPVPQKLKVTLEEMLP
ncbi:hypothetical protein ES708_11390 [subsurface metagenome]